MSHSLKAIAEDIRQINRLLEKYEQARSLSLDDKKLLFSIYKDCKDTNAVIASVTQSVKAGEQARVTAEAQLAKEAAQEFAEIYKRSATLFDTFETQSDIKAYLQPLEDEIKSESEVAKNLREEMRTIDHRMSHVWTDSQEYADYSSQHDNVKAKYDTTSAHINELNLNKRKIESELAPLFYFDMVFVVVLVDRIAQIADNVIADVDSFGNYIEFDHSHESDARS